MRSRLPAKRTRARLYYNLSTFTTGGCSNMILAESVLVESKSARNNQLERMSHEGAQSVLSKIKILYFALWKGEGIATTEQLADFYEVPVGTIRPLLKPHKDEFESFYRHF